ncbi:phenylalanine--tRNA ligase subunit beta [Patescibacteria group bacterium]|nr:phenylalanine--tRNA ligase subunit beta [Patescibacteria group bacterium]
MLIPLSWLKEYVDIKMPFPKLAERMSEVGLTIETWREVEGDIIFDPEVTPNRGDWMSITGIAREVAAATGTKYTAPKLIAPPDKVKNPLEIKYKEDLKICPKTSTVIIRNVKVKSSPEWLQKRIKQIGLRPINNLVDITNYVLWLYGNPLHVFDYDKIRGHTMSVELAKGGEEFRSLDGINYRLPKDAIVIKDLGRVIDLPPLKGGENTAVSAETKNVLLHSIVCDPVLTRRVSQALGLRSDSSAVSERGVDPNGTTKAVLKALELILELAGGEVASPLMDVPEKPFPSWTVEVSHEHLERVLGIPVKPEKAKEIWESLELKTAMRQLSNGTMYSIEIPTFRNDLHIEEDLVEEVGRMIGYNSFPKTLPASPVPTTKVAYVHDYDFDYQIKQILKGAGYSEIYSYSLISEEQLNKLGINPSKTLRVDNPISKEYEYLRPVLIGNLLESLKLNLPNFSDIRLYEMGKIYRGDSCDKATEELWVDAILSGEKFYQAKGIIENVLDQLGIDFEIVPAEPDSWTHPGRTAWVQIEKKTIGFIFEIHPRLLAKFGINSRTTYWSLNRDILYKTANTNKVYSPISKYPPVIEDVSLVIPDKVLVGEVVDIIKENKLVSSVEMIDQHESSKTFRITYLDPTKNLTDKEVAEVKTKILKSLKEKLKVSPKS